MDDEAEGTNQESEDFAGPEQTSEHRCPACDQPISIAVRRCPHCGTLLAGKKIVRPEKLFAEEGSPAWKEAAQRVSELGELEWEAGVHPINEDTHPLGEAPPFPQNIPETTARAKRGKLRLWLLLAGASILFFMLAGLGVLAYLQQSNISGNVAAEATHEAAKVGGHPTQTGGKNEYTPGPGHVPTSIVPPTASIEQTPTLTLAPTPTFAPQLVMAINAGGGAFGNYSADKDFNGGQISIDSAATIDTSGVSNPAPQGVYNCERNGIFTYTLPHLQPDGHYFVRLHFVELWFNVPKYRVFNVSINGTVVLEHFDIYALVGALNKAIVEAFPVTADPKGVITIAFTRVPPSPFYPKVSGLELYTAP